MGDVSEESLLDYIFTAGGKVKNADLLKTYKHFVNHNDKQLRAKYREEFKLVIDKIAVVKSENGEKYLVLKKKYKQLMQEREAEKGMPRQRQASPPRPAAMVQWEGGEVRAPDKSQKSPRQDTYPFTSAPVERTEVKKPAVVSWCGAPAITVTEAPEQEAEEGGQQIDEAPSLSAAEETSDTETEERSTSQDDDSPAPINGEDQLDRDTESKGEAEQEAEPEQEDEGTGSIGSNSVALDPLEKEWMHSAACGRLAHLTQLLKQEPSLACKKDFTSGFTALHWAAKHGKGDMAALIANAGADVNIKAHGGYTPLHIAALHGHQHIMDLLIGTYGAKENVRDYSGHLACHYLSTRESPAEYTQLDLQVAQAGERRNRKLGGLFHPKSSWNSRKKWGSMEDLAPVVEERAAATHQLSIPAFRPRKFSR